MIFVAGGQCLFPFTHTHFLSILHSFLLLQAWDHIPSLTEEYYFKFPLVLSHQYETLSLSENVFIALQWIFSRFRILDLQSFPISTLRKALLCLWTSTASTEKLAISLAPFVIFPSDSLRFLFVFGFKTKCDVQ